MSKYFSIITAILYTAGAALAANDGGTESPFAFGAGARELSLGGADLAACNFETAPFWNPARLATAQQYQISGFHSRLFDADVAYQYLGLITPTLDFGTFGIGIFRLGVSGIEVRDVNNFLLGETADNRLALFLAYGRSLSNFDIGAAITFEHHSLADYSATSTPGLNLSAAKTMLLNSKVFKTVSVAVNVTNAIKPSIELDADNVSYPLSGAMSVTLGMKPLKDPDHSLALAASIRKTDQVNPHATVGLEYALNDLLFLRTGFNDANIAAGLGLKYSAVSFDYAIVDRDLDLLHTFTLTTSFGKPVNQRRAEKLAKREAEFNRLMGERLTEKNRGLVTSMTQEGQKYLDEGRLTEAVATFERALFMAKANTFDTAKINELVINSRIRLDEILNLKQYRENMDSAHTALARKDYISARYFATAALEQQPNANEPKQIIDKAAQALNQITARAEFIQERLAKADSLLSAGQITEAINLLNGLKQSYADDSRVSQLHKKAHFERLREKATKSYTQRKFGEALAALDSTLVLYPNHEWCLALKASIISTQNVAAKTRTAAAPKIVARPSEQLLKEAENEYAIAQSMFTSGNLNGAITHWENVERLVPQYQSVREYLFKAYKFLGVEYYSQGMLREAINVWEKALLVVPDNDEIQTYILRTETELKKLEQLSYESK